MKQVLWAKAESVIDAEIQAFLAGQDVILDRELLPFDIVASIAHVHGLSRIGVINSADAESLVNQLRQLAQLVEKGEFVLDERYEDGHSAIEMYLTEKLGDLGKKVHTGRSRNDQVLVAMRLYLRDRIRQLESINYHIAKVCLTKAETHQKTVMPGYTHLQRAVPSTVGLWMAAFAEAFIDNRDVARGTFSVIDGCPLGTAAGYGVNLALDRDGVAEELGFSRLTINPMYAQNSRGKLEILALRALEQSLLDVRRLAWDLSLYTTSEFAFVKLPDIFTTGSSIMPNKRNPDVVELLRAAYAVVSGAILELSQVLGLTSGYHRDLQATKGPALRAFSHGLMALSLVPRLIEQMSFDEKAMAAAISPELFATDRAVELAVAGVPFRDAYKQAAAAISTMSGDAHKSVNDRVSPGATARLLLDRLAARLSQ